VPAISINRAQLCGNHRCPAQWNDLPALSNGQTDRSAMLGGCGVRDLRSRHFYFVRQLFMHEKAALAASHPGRSRRTRGH
jgi:hypothetical protein